MTLMPGICQGGTCSFDPCVFLFDSASCTQSNGEAGICVNQVCEDAAQASLSEAQAGLDQAQQALAEAQDALAESPSAAAPMPEPNSGGHD